MDKWLLDPARIKKVIVINRKIGFRRGYEQAKLDFLKTLESISADRDLNAYQYAILNVAHKKIAELKANKECKYENALEEIDRKSISEFRTVEGTSEVNGK